VFVASLVLTRDVFLFLSYTLHALIRQTNRIICKKNTCKPFQNHAKCAQGIPLRGNEVSNAFNHTRMDVFMKNIRKKCTKEISHDLGKDADLPCDKNIRSHEVLPSF
jgi:hypothetical protein